MAPEEEAKEISTKPKTDDDMNFRISLGGSTDVLVDGTRVTQPEIGVSANYETERFDVGGGLSIGSKLARLYAGAKYKLLNKNGIELYLKGSADFINSFKSETTTKYIPGEKFLLEFDEFNSAAGVRGNYNAKAHCVSFTPGVIMKKPEATYDNTYLPKEFSVDAGIGIKYKKNKTSLWGEVSYEYTSDLNPDKECVDYFNPESGTCEVDGTEYHYTVNGPLVNNTFSLEGNHNTRKTPVFNAGLSQTFGKKNNFTVSAEVFYRPKKYGFSGIVTLGANF